jgi:hypothetical protein
MKNKYHTSNAFLKYFKHFFAGFSIGILVYGITIYSYSVLKHVDFVMTIWTLQRAILMGSVWGVGSVMGTLPVSPTIKRRFLVFSTVILVGFLLLIMFAFAYVRFFAF